MSLNPSYSQMIIVMCLHGLSKLQANKQISLTLVHSDPFLILLCFFPPVVMVFEPMTLQWRDEEEISLPQSLYPT